MREDDILEDAREVHSGVTCPPGFVDERTVLIEGTAVPKGSWVTLTKPFARTIYTNQKELDRWAAVCIAAFRSQWTTGLVPGGVVATLRFEMPRYDTHYTKAGNLSKNAPWEMAQKPDLDKLTRAILDSATGFCYTDDSRIVRLEAEKVWTKPGQEKVWAMFGQSEREQMTMGDVT